jgi:rare lipoprotein A
MQTKLRMTSVWLLAFVAGLLWTSMLAAAPAPQATRAQLFEQALKQLVKAKFGGKTQYVGIASWYGKQHQGLKMANGKPFDRRKMTAAAWNMPLGTVVKVVNLKNGKSVVVTITDRGPHPRLNRVIDLSEAAAAELGYIKEGLTSVFISRMPTGRFESAEITAELVEPPADLPASMPAGQEEQPAETAVVAASL